MKKIMCIIIMFLILTTVNALEMCEGSSLNSNNYVFVNSIKETTKNDSYDTIERNTTIIGKTKFTSNEVITALKATKAGSNDALIYLSQNNTSDGYTNPTIYIYYGEIGGWYSLNENNVSTYITDTNLIKKLSEQNIYFVNNKEKVVYVNYDVNSLKCLNSNMLVKNSKLYSRINKKTLEIKKKDNSIKQYTFNDNTGKFIEV